MTYHFLHRQSFAILFFLLAGFLLALPQPSQATSPPPEILLVNSYHEGYKGTDDIVAGFRSILNTSLPDVSIKTEYLDSKNNSGEVYNKKLVELLRTKYRENHFELIVATDDYAFNIVEKYYDELFASTPVVFCGTNAFDLKRLTGKADFVGVDERPSFKETIELITQLRPQTRRIVVIHDDSLVGQINSATFRLEAAGFTQKIEFEYLAGLLEEDLLDRIQTLSSDTAVFYFASFIMDHKGHVYSSGDALKNLAAHSPVPIFGGWEFNLGHGIIGGKLINLFEHGTLAGSLAVEILTEHNPDSLPKLSPSPNQFMFDDLELQRFEIKDKQLPPESIIINRPPTFYQQNRADIFIALSVLLTIIVSGSFVILYQSRLRLRKSYEEQLQIEKSLRASQADLEQAMAEVKTLRGILPICSFCKKIRDEEGEYTQIEMYIHKHSGVDFSHTVCPNCMKKHYPEYSD